MTEFTRRELYQLFDNKQVCNYFSDGRCLYVDVFVNYNNDFIRFKLRKIGCDGYYKLLYGNIDFAHITLNDNFGYVVRSKIRQILLFYKNLFPKLTQLGDIIDLDLENNSVNIYEFGFLEDIYKLYNLKNSIKESSLRIINGEMTLRIGYAIKNDFSKLTEDDMLVVKNRLDVVVDINLSIMFLRDCIYIYKEFKSYDDMLKSMTNKKWF